jgi:hypothetical protein
MKHFIVIFSSLFVLLTTGCDQPKTISNDELASIFHDALLTNAYVGQKNLNVDSLYIYEPILAKYGYTKEDLHYTLENFLKQKSAHLSDVITVVNDRLAAESAALRAEVVRLDTVRNVALRHSKRYLFELEEPVKARTAADTSKLIFKVPMQGPGEYVISAVYSIDKSDEGQGRRLTANFLAGDSVTYHQYATIMHRIDSADFRTQFSLNRTMAEKYDTIRIHFNDFATRIQNRPKYSLITIHSASVLFTPEEQESLEELFREQFDDRIFARRTIEAIEAEWIAEQSDSLKVEEPTKEEQNKQEK